MNKSALLALGSALVFGLPLVASAYDDDPGYGQYRPWYGSEDRTWRSGGERGDRDRDRDRYIEPIFYRPTQRYYAKGYTVSYRYMPVYYYEAFHGGAGQQNQSSNFRTEAFRLETRDIPAWGAKPPRLVVANRRTPSQTAITSIVPTYGSKTGYGSGSGSGYGSGASYGMPDLKALELKTPSAPLPTPNLDLNPPVKP